MGNQQVALAACLAASAMAHLPIQPEIHPLQSPQLPARCVRSVRPKQRRPPVRIRPVVQHVPHPYDEKLRFVSDREHCKRVERADSRGNCGSITTNQFNNKKNQQKKNYLGAGGVALYTAPVHLILREKKKKRFVWSGT